MSRIGNKLIVIPAGVTVTVEDNNHVIVKGPKGTIDYTFVPSMKIEVEEGQIKISRPNDSIEHKTLHGTTRALLHNMVEGVANGFSRTLEIQGVGYRAALQGKTLVVSAGYSHTVEMPIPEGITVVVPSQTEITISGVDKQKVGQFAAEVRAVRPPEPYKGKGIRYKGEAVRRKESKKSK